MTTGAAARTARPHAERRGAWTARLAASALPLALGALVALCATPHLAGAQTVADPCVVRLSGTDFVGPSADMSRVLDLLGARSSRSFLIRRTSDRFEYRPCEDVDAVRQMADDLSLPAYPLRGAAVLPVDIHVSGNSAYPRDWNDGAQWGGAGLSGSLTTGALLRWGVFEAAVAPLLTGYQNGAFETLPYPDPEYSQFIDRWRGRFIDMPQRFGTASDISLGPGQSYLRISARGLRAGVSTENLKWGPARRNPLLLSGTAGGFPHAFVESARAHDAWIGDAEFQVFLARLTESDYFDHNPENDHRALSGIILTLRPRGLDGLYIGAGRLHSQPWTDATGTGDLLLGPITGVDSDSSAFAPEMQLFSLFMRWVAAPAGFEVYGEWARQDTWKNWVRLLNPMEATQAYTLGAQKVVRRGDNAVRLTAEISHLSDAIAHADLGRWQQTIYASSEVVHGHTHRGQLLGAPIGPGSESQFIGADVFWNYGRTSLSVERARYDDDAYYAVWGAIHGPHGHDTEISVRGGHLLTHPAFSVEAEVGYSFRYSRDFIGLHHGNFPGFPYRTEDNLSLRLTGRWNPPALSWER